MEKILINATQPEELRVALVQGQKLYDLDVETKIRKQKKSDIHLGVISRIEPSLNAAFVDYGEERHGFLSLKEIAPEYYAKPRQDGQTFTVNDAVYEGQVVLIQIDKEERGNKGAALTTYISLAGCYLVLMPNNPDAGGVSRRIEGDERKELREALDAINLPEGMGVIIRTAGISRSVEDLQWDLDILLKQWEAIVNASKQQPAPCLIHQEGNAVIRAIRDYLRDEVQEILIDEEEAFKTAEQYVKVLRPDFASRVKRYQDAIPLFSRYQVESQIEMAYQQAVNLPSGGSIVIEPTEALVTIDVNSYKSTGSGNIEETALHTNLEAADEIARQLRIRDMGGLIVVDFIDMFPTGNKREVEERLREACRRDRARIQIGRISRFGLLEMSRQRLRPSLKESQLTCPRCEGQGTVRSIESMALAILRLAEENALKPETMQVQIQVPVEMATYLTNEKRSRLIDIELRHQAPIIVISNKYFENPYYEIKAFNEQELRSPDVQGSSYEFAKSEVHSIKTRSVPQRTQYAEEPVVKSIPMQMDAPVRGGLIKRLWSSVFTKPTKSPEQEATESNESANRNSRSSTRRQEQSSGRRRQSRSSGSRSNSNRSGGNSSRSNNRSGNRGGNQRPSGNKRTGGRSGGNSRGGNRNNQNARGRQQHAQDPNQENTQAAAPSLPQPTEPQLPVAASEPVSQSVPKSVSQPSESASQPVVDNHEQANSTPQQRRRGGGTRNPYRLQSRRRSNKAETENQPEASQGDSFNQE